MISSQMTPYLWGKAESSFSKIRDKTNEGTLISPIQHNTGNPSQNN